MKSTALHTMARHYLRSRRGKQPRTYGVVAAMLAEVVRLDPDDLPAPRQLAAALATAAGVPCYESLRATGAEAEVIDEERRLFREAIRSWLHQDFAVEPLPYERLLGDEEAAVWNRRLHERWGHRVGLWMPTIDADAPAGMLRLATSAMQDDGPGAELLPEVLRGMGLSRVIEIREPGTTVSLIDVDLVEAFYTGVEAVWIDETLDWIIYTSHNWTVEISGTLADRLRAAWPDVDDWLWERPDWY
ncbi:hypothetical protein JNUCC0626_21300 [Lentzea sp. JNUCC 0626]|uniref:hypothetical protein n=1 Tax=Lentzea sp. JNUCC 0626 TaxID=3367513 RepID=UPI00374A64B7